MIAWDVLGYLASALVLAAFCMKEMMPLRFVAVCSNMNQRRDRVSDFESMHKIGRGLHKR